MKWRVVTVLLCVMGMVDFTSADTVRGISIDFVSIGNANNPADTGGTIGTGSVAYNYRIGKYEVTDAQWNAFVSAAGVPNGNSADGYSLSAEFITDDRQPTNRVSWYEALQFCNYLTSGDKSKGVYQFSGSNVSSGSFLGINRSAAEATYGTIYFLPTEDEWYKAAYFKPDGSGYSIYANGLDTIPAADNGWNYSGGIYSRPWNVGSGLMEQNGTYDMMGNVWEWNETLVLSDRRGLVGGSYNWYGDIDSALASPFAYGYNYPYHEFGDAGFRVASTPEPTTLLLLGLGGVLIRAKNGKRKAYKNVTF